MYQHNIYILCKSNIFIDRQHNLDLYKYISTDLNNSMEEYIGL